MTDREMFELLVADAPTPRPGHEVDVLRVARRARLRRRLAGVGAGLGVAAVGAAVAITAASTVGGGPGPAVPDTASRPSAARAGEADAYVTAVRGLAEEVRGAGPRWRVLYVLDHTCANVVTPTDGSCAAQPLPGPLREELAAGLGPYARVRFVAEGDAVRGPGLVVKDGGALVTLGRIRLSGDAADVPLSVQQSGLNGRGLTYHLTRHGASWWIAGTIGPEWIS